ncbi:hypothetical protein MCOR25_008407 [Pyricularia grisea]|nr:hypothetical protein MCOR25_008407 [Pyricularia grisea]
MATITENLDHLDVDNTFPIATTITPDVLQRYGGVNHQAAQDFGDTIIGSVGSAPYLAKKWDEIVPGQTFYIYLVDTCDYASSIRVLRWLDDTAHKPSQPLSRDVRLSKLTVKMWAENAPIPWTSILSYTMFVPGKASKTTDNTAWKPNGGVKVFRDSLCAWHIPGRTVYHSLWSEWTKPRYGFKGL